MLFFLHCIVLERLYCCWPIATFEGNETEVKATVVLFQCIITSNIRGLIFGVAQSLFKDHAEF